VRVCECECECVCVCLCVCVFVCVRLCVHTQICVRERESACLYAQTHPHTHEGVLLAQCVAIVLLMCFYCVASVCC
jgi:hypothetical protein